MLYSRWHSRVRKDNNNNKTMLLQKLCNKWGGAPIVNKMHLYSTRDYNNQTTITTSNLWIYFFCYYYFYAPYINRLSLFLTSKNASCQATENEKI